MQVCHTKLEVQVVVDSLRDGIDGIFIQIAVLYQVQIVGFVLKAGACEKRITINEDIGFRTIVENKFSSENWDIPFL